MYKIEETQTEKKNCVASYLNYPMPDGVDPVYAIYRLLRDQQI
jgi:hypothetical protein